MTPEPPPGARLPSMIGRLHYLAALQEHWPEFWQAARRVACIVTKRTNRTPELVTSWGDLMYLWAPFFEEFKVTEDWLVNAVIETSVEWAKHPDSPAARLEPGAPWYCYGSDLLVPRFTPQLLGFDLVLSNPYLLKHHPGEESPTEDAIATFRARCMKEFQEQFRPRANYLPVKKAQAIRAAFKRQLDNYVGVQRELLLPRRETWNQAQMLVLSRKGLSDRDIAVKWERDFGQIIEEEAIRKGRRRLEAALS